MTSMLQVESERITINIIDLRLSIDLSIGETRRVFKWETPRPLGGRRPHRQEDGPELAPASGHMWRRLALVLQSREYISWQLEEAL